MSDDTFAFHEFEVQVKCTQRLTLQCRGDYVYLTNDRGKHVGAWGPGLGVELFGFAKSLDVSAVTKACEELWRKHNPPKLFEFKGEVRLSEIRCQCGDEYGVDFIGVDTKLTLATDVPPKASPSTRFVVTVREVRG